MIVPKGYGKLGRAMVVDHLDPKYQAPKYNPAKHEPRYDFPVNVRRIPNWQPKEIAA